MNSLGNRLKEHSSSIKMQGRQTLTRLCWYGATVRDLVGQSPPLPVSPPQSCFCFQLNVPLELSGLEHSPLDLGAAGEYRDQGLLHTLGDPWLDLRVVTSSSGAVCICHHYIYKVREIGRDLYSLAATFGL